MADARTIPVYVEIKGKGTIKDKLMKIDGPDITMEGLAGAWFWIKKEGIFKIGSTVFHTGNYDPDKEILCSIIPAENEARIRLPYEKISLNELEFEKLDTGEDDDETGDEEETPQSAAPETEPEKTASVEDSHAAEQAEAFEEERGKLENEIQRLNMKIKELKGQHATELEKAKQDIEDARLRISNSAKEIIKLQNMAEELKNELESARQHKERMEEALKNQIDELKSKMDEDGKEHALTVETYEKTVKDRRATFAKISKWMTRVSGLDEKVNVNEKAQKIEKLVLERWDLLEENKRLKKITAKGKPKKSEEKPPPETPRKTETDKNTMTDGFDEEIENAFKYVVVSIHMHCKGDQYETLDKVDRLLNSFHIIDPEEVGISEKDLLVVRDYFEMKMSGHSQNGSQDMGAMINFFKDELEKILELPEFSDPHKRVGFRQQLRERYDGYIPKSSR